MENKPNLQPPKFWLAFLRWFCREDLLEDVEGDLLELFYYIAESSPKKAKRLLVVEVFKLFRPRMIKSYQLQNTNYMYRNFFKVAYRNALNYKGYTLLNLLGLVLGITTSMLIYLWVEDETSKDQFHTHIERIYSVKRNMQQTGGSIITTSNIPHPLADLVKESYSEVEAVCEMSWPIESLFQKEDELTFENGRIVSPNFFEFFSYELIHGDSKQMLQDPTSIVISEDLAKKYLTGTRYDYTDLIGESIKIEEEFDVSIAGVFKNPGVKSSFQFDWLLSSESYVKRNTWMQSWENGAFNINLLLRDPSEASAVSERIYSEIEDHTERVNGETLWIQNFGDTYLYDDYKNGKAIGGRITYVRIMQAVAIFILLIACVNYMNLTTARSSRRAKEIGVRKVMGAFKNSIVRQFYAEAFLYALFAVTISLLFTYSLLPFYNKLVGKQLFINLLENNRLVYVFLLLIIIGIISGSYPALRLSKLSLLTAMKNFGKRKQGLFSVRKGLVVFQIAISFILLFGTLVIGNQIRYMLNKDTGINKENIIAIWLEGDLNKKFETYRTQLLQINGVKAVTGASGNPVAYNRSTSSIKWEGKDEDTPYEINIITTYDQYFKNLGLEIVQGRDFLEKSVADSSSFIINETAASLMGFKNPIGKKVSVWGIQGHIIGVVEDYHSLSLRREIAPLVVVHAPNDTQTALITLEGNISNALANIETLTKQMNPNYIFEFEFLEESYAKMYDTERLMAKLSSIFVGISIVIAVLGLLGLSAYSAEKRTKEIGIRKVHGASTLTLLVLLSKEYAILMLVAFTVAVPFSYWFMADWLNTFAYKITLGVENSLITALLLFLICISTVLFKAYQSTRSNPVKTLRSE